MNKIQPEIDLKLKQKKTIDVWKNMTISELAIATGIPVGKINVLTEYIYQYSK